MPKRDDPKRLLYPGFTGRIMVDTWRGKVRVRKWPEKRGRPASPAVRAQNDWFRDANRLASKAPGSQMASAIAITKNSGLYPRDILIRMMAGNLGPIPLQDGRTLSKATKRIEPVTFQGARVELAAATAIAGNILLTLSWPLPIFDPLGFWSAGAPTRLTVPDNVSVVRVTGRLAVNAGGTQRLRGRLNWNGALASGFDSGLQFSTNGVADTGPLWVNPGDYFELQAVSSRSGTLVAGPPNSFSIEILTAV